MPKLPMNLVRPAPPVFDNPLRRTTLTSMPPHEAAEGSSDDLPIVADGAVIVLPTPPPNTDDAAAPQLNARITVRIDDAVFVALQTECYQRRIRGEKTNTAEVAREILGAWAQGRS